MLRGRKLALFGSGLRDNWLNVSRYADPADVPLPTAGKQVVLT